MPRQFYVVDAFTSRPFGGNPAGVVLDAEGLTDDQMQQIAAEFNHSETAFILSWTPESTIEPNTTDREPDATFRIRWFTPTVEVSMCGHATLAGVTALLDADRLPPPHSPEGLMLRIQTKSGPLTMFVEKLPGEGGAAQTMLWLELRPAKLDPLPIPVSAWALASRVPADAFEMPLPPARTQDDDALVFVKDPQTLNAARPDFGRLDSLLREHALRGLCLSTANTVTPSISAQSRFFTPPCGIDEDPVTGSVHGPLAAYLVRQGLVPLHDGVAGMQCVQGIPGGRSGLVSALVSPEADGRYAVRIGGQAIITMKGNLLA